MTVNQILRSCGYDPYENIKELKHVDNPFNGKPNPEEGHRYLANDGLYYNGYALSPDATKGWHPFGELFKKLEKEIFFEMYDHGNGD